MEAEPRGKSHEEKTALKGWSVSFSVSARKHLGINPLTLLSALPSLAHLLLLSNLEDKGTRWCNPYRSASWGRLRGGEGQRIELGVQTEVNSHS